MISHGEIGLNFTQYTLKTGPWDVHEKLGGLRSSMIQ